MAVSFCNRQPTLTPPAAEILEPPESSRLIAHIKMNLREVKILSDKSVALDALVPRLISGIQAGGVRRDVLLTTADEPVRFD
jgi:hypothetical protein